MACVWYHERAAPGLRPALDRHESSVPRGEWFNLKESVKWLLTRILLNI